MELELWDAPGALVTTWAVDNSVDNLLEFGEFRSLRGKKSKTNACALPLI